MSHQCPAYQSHGQSGANRTRTLPQGVRAKPYMEYARTLVGASATEADKKWWFPDGWCEKPKVDIYVRGKEPSPTALLNDHSLMNLFFRQMETLSQKISAQAYGSLLLYPMASSSTM